MGEGALPPKAIDLEPEKFGLWGAVSIACVIAPAFANWPVRLPAVKVIWPSEGGDSPSVSYRAIGTMSVSISWKPSGRSPSTSKCRLILAGASTRHCAMGQGAWGEESVARFKLVASEIGRAHV